MIPWLLIRQTSRVDMSGIICMKTYIEPTISFSSLLEDKVKFSSSVDTKIKMNTELNFKDGGECR